jgi:hypothetical protein
MTDSIEAPEGAPKPRASRAKTADPALPTNIKAIIPLIREELGAVVKDQETLVGTKYKYRGHDQIVNAIVPLFNKYGLFTTVEDKLLKYSGRNAGTKYATASLIAKKVTFWAPDGTWVASTIVAESVDYSNKATGQASTYAYRIALEQTFTIPTGEADPDSNAAELEPTSAPVQPKTQPVTQAAAGPSDEVKELRGAITILFKGRGVTEPKDVKARGEKFFNGREGWESNVGALNKLKKALEDGEAVGE